MMAYLLVAVDSYLWCLWVSATSRMHLAYSGRRGQRSHIVFEADIPVSSRSNPERNTLISPHSVMFICMHC